MVEHGTLAALPVLDEALGNLVDRDADRIDRALDLDDTLRALGEHLLGCNHARTREVLDVLDLETLAANHGSHQVVRDEQPDARHVGRGLGRGAVSVDGRVQRVLEDGLGNERKGLGDACKSTAHAEDTVVDAGDDLGDTGLDAGLFAELGNVGTALANDDTGLLGADESTDGEGRVGVDIGGGNTVSSSVGGGGGGSRWRECRGILAYSLGGGGHTDIGGGSGVWGV